MKSIKTQFAVVISILVVVLLAANAGYLIKQKESEMTADIFDKVYSFANLTAEDIATSYQEDILVARAPSNFEISKKEILNLNSSISGFRIATYGGKEVYTTAESAQDQLDRSENIENEMLITRLQSQNSSVKTLDGRVVYLKQNPESERGFDFVDVNENPTEALSANTRIENFIIRTKDNKHSIIYETSYATLDRMLADTIFSIIALTAIGVIIAVIVSFILAGRIAAPIIKLARYVKTLASSDNRRKIKVKSKNEIGQLATSFNQMIDDLAKYEEELVDQERMQTELRLAASIQEDLIPKEIPQPEGLELAASITPAAEIGGDCYDFFTDKDGELVFYIGDVTGHGVPAGLVVSIANALFYYFSANTDVTSELLTLVNSVLKPKTKPNMFLTAMACRWEEKNKKLFYSSAGHEPPLHYSKKTKEVKDLNSGGMALGMIPDISKIVNEFEAPLESGDVMVLYTDGIPEAWGPAETEEEKKEGHGFYEMDRFRAVLKKYAEKDLSAQEILDGILKEVHEYMGDIPSQDDVTILVMKKK